MAAVTRIVCSSVRSSAFHARNEFTVMTAMTRTAVPTYFIRGYASEGNEMAFTFASPAKVFYHDADVKQVDVPSFSGSFGILPHHVPSLAVLKPGVLTVFEKNGDAKKFFVSSGSVTINDDSSVQILAEEAVSIEDLDPKLCRDGLAQAQQQAASATGDLDKAEAQIAVEVHEALVKAVE